jgi:hypothetical protein
MSWPLHTMYVYEKFGIAPLSKDDLMDNLHDCMVSSTDEWIIKCKFSRAIDTLMTSNRQKRKGSRVQVIVFHWILGPHGSTIEYQLCSFVDRTGKEQYSKRFLRNTAIQRFQKNPLTIPVLGEVDLHRVKHEIRHELQKRRKMATTQEWCHEYV